MFNGILPLYKPRGMTSHDAIYKLRKILKMKRIGHTGTLDPDVDGVLPICLGPATRVAEYITDGIKAYKGTIILGTTTTTEDASGEVLEKKEVEHPLSRAEIQHAFEQFVGEIRQTPPMYSAVKVNGKKLYEYAREGQAVERPTRHVMIHSISLLNEAEAFTDRIPFQVVCGKGTYVRTLAVQIGEKLGYPAHLDQLTRMVSGGYSLDDCHTLEDIQKAVEKACFADLLAPIERAFQSFPKWFVDEEQEKRVKNGAVLPLPKGFNKDRLAVYNDEGMCLAVYKAHPQKEGLIKPEKVFVQS